MNVAIVIFALNGLDLELYPLYIIVCDQFCHQNGPLRVTDVMYIGLHIRNLMYNRAMSIL